MGAGGIYCRVGGSGRERSGGWGDSKVEGSGREGSGDGKEEGRDVGGWVNIPQSHSHSTDSM